MQGRSAGGTGTLPGVTERMIHPDRAEPKERSEPRIIQGGMGAGISDWRLARAVSHSGELGVVSGTALDSILVRRLWDGDREGQIRWALDRFPDPAMAERIRLSYFVAAGRSGREPYPRVLPELSHSPARERVELLIVANFVEVLLARVGHDNPVGINYLEKIQIPLLPSIYGAMMAGVSYVLMGAGIPLRIPGALDRLANHEAASYSLHVTGASESDGTSMRFDPREFLERPMAPLSRPKFLAIISSNVLAETLLRRSNGTVDGFVVEGPTAGGHNAPPRGRLQVDARGPVVYGERDRVDLERIRALGRPFWLAGGYGRRGRLGEALGAGATGIQVGTPFAFCAESGLRDDYKQAILAQALRHGARVFTDGRASPTSFPFKVAELEGTLSDATVFEARSRVCDLGYLREAYVTPDGDIGYRCPAEPVAAYVEKGGCREDTEGRRCLCNALLANVGLGQLRAGQREPGLVTAGMDLNDIARFLPEGATSYRATQVIEQLLAGEPSQPATGND